LKYSDKDVDIVNLGSPRSFFKTSI